MKALLVGAEDDLRDQMRTPRLLRLAERCAALAPMTGLHAALASLGRRWLALHQEILQLAGLITDLVETTAPALLARPGIGAHSGAQLLITAGANPDRLRSEAAFAALCRGEPRPSQ